MTCPAPLHRLLEVAPTLPPSPQQDVAVTRTWASSVMVAPSPRVNTFCGLGGRGLWVGTCDRAGARLGQEEAGCVCSPWQHFPVLVCDRICVHKGRSGQA